MIPLPNSIVLDFLDWMSKEERALEALMETEGLDKNLLEKYAIEFIKQTQSYECYNDYGIIQDMKRLAKKIKHNYPEIGWDIDWGIQQITKYIETRNVRDDLGYGYKRYNNDSPGYLVDSLLFYLNNKDLQKNDVLLSFLVSSGKEISPIMDFCDWLKEKNRFVPMPVEITQEMISDYTKDRKRSLSRGERRKLEKILKPNIYQKIKDYINNIGNKHYYKIEDFFCRYKESRFKCMILPLKGSEDIDLKSFIKRYWDDLNKMSGDKLDIFYAVEELEETGYSIKNFFCLDSLSSELIPCIAIWEKEIREARYISINGLDSRQLVQVFSGIVSSIEKRKNIDEICRIGAEKVKNLKDSKKNIVNNYTDSSMNYVNQNITHNNNGTIIGLNKGNIDNTFCMNNDARELFPVIDDLKVKLSEICEMNETQKIFFEKILDDFREADLINDATQKNNIKMRFESFIMGLPKTALNMLNISGSLASIASFLGLNISNLL